MKLLLTTFGSLGDLHPYIALGLALKGRGHEVAIAASPTYREKIEGEGLGFHPISPSFEEFGAPEEWMPKAMDEMTAPQFVIRTLVLPYLDRAYEDLKAAAPGYDAIIGHPLTFAVPVVCEELGIPWISVMLQPVTLFSVYDPPLLAGVPFARGLNKLGPRFHRWFYSRIKSLMGEEQEQAAKLRARAGLPTTDKHPMFEGMRSPLLNLCVFSPLFGPPQTDWPPNTHATGFLFYDKATADDRLSPEIEKFLDEGPAPIVFTLGSSAVHSPGTFYAESVEAARILKRRAILLTGRDSGFDTSKPLPNGVRAFDYAPYSALFPRAAAIVHQGGVGTTAQALRSGKPQIVVPFAHDQPDNAQRVGRLGAGSTVPRDKYSATLVAKELSRLLSDSSFAEAAARVGESIRGENGAENACIAVEQALARPR